MLNGKLHKLPKPTASAPKPNENTQPVQEPPPHGHFPKMPISRIMPGMTVTTRIPMEQVPNGSKQNCPMPLGFMTSMEICGNGSRIFPVTITVLMQTESPIRRAPWKVNTGLLVEAIIPSPGKRCAPLSVNPKPNPPNTLGSASGFAPPPDGQLCQNDLIGFNNPFFGKLEVCIQYIKKIIGCLSSQKISSYNTLGTLRLSQPILFE